MLLKTLILTFIAFGSLAQAAQSRRVYRTNAPLSSDASQADVLTQIDKGVRDFNPSLAGPNWVIYPEDHPKIAVAASDRQKSLEPQKPDELDEALREGVAMDEILVH